jgi:hypothetical protein
MVVTLCWANNMIYEYVACQEMRVDSRWRTCIICKSLQKYDVKVHKNSVDHINSIARWEVVHFSQCANASLMIKG